MSAAGDNLWGEEEPFSDMPEAAQTVYNQEGKAVVPQNTGYVPPVQQPQRPNYPPQSPQRQQAIERSNQAIAELNGQEEEVEEDDSNIFTDAELRLEQGKLYKLIMKHDLFEDVEADERAIQNVQRAIRKFAKEQMEIMLGMRSEQTSEQVQVASPFNALEVEVLKTIASTFSKGATEQYEEETAPLPVVQKRKTLNPIGGPSKKASSQPKPLSSKPGAPVKRRASGSLDETIERIAAEEGVPRELLEEGKLSTKPIEQLSRIEIEEKNRQIALRRGARVANPQAAPMPSQEEIAQRTIMNATVVSQGAQKNGLWSTVMDKVKAMPQSLNHVPHHEDT